MSIPAMTEAVENVARTAEPPPIAMVLPLLQLVPTGFSLLFRLGFNLLLTLAYPLHTIWSIVHALLSPVFIVVKITFAIVFSTPFSIIRTIVGALYPVYAFCLVACIIGALVGIFGHYVSTAILSVLFRSKYFAPGAPSATRPSSPQAMLRKRKRKSVSVRLQ